MTRYTGFVKGYVDAMLFTENEELSERTINDISPELESRIIADCDKFTSLNERDLGKYSAYMEKTHAGRPDFRAGEWAGHDFWLTRNRHGAGFWDRGTQKCFANLTQASHQFPEFSIWVDANGKIQGE